LGELREVLTANSSTISDQDGLGAFSYQWYRDGVSITDATSATYKVAGADIEEDLTVAVSYTDTFGKEETVVSAAVTPDANDPSVTVVVTDGKSGEDGDLATFTVALESEVKSDVTITFQVSDATEAELLTSAVTFTPDNWEVIQAVTIKGLDDYDDDGDVSYDVTGILTTDGLNYAGVSILPMSFLNKDDQEDADIQLYGTNAVDYLQGMNGDDRLYGLGNLDELRGGRGNDRLYGGYDNDRLYGEEGDDELYGEEDDDLLEGGDGNDELYGGGNSDILKGGDGNDILNGGTGNDKLAGAKGKDVLKGQNGKDDLHGGAKNDILKGGKGNDNLTGGKGNDTLTGGDDKDKFVFTNTTHGKDTITDFEDGSDQVKLKKLGIDFDDLTIRKYDDGAGTKIIYNDLKILIEDVVKADIDAGDFIF
jgi:Ca2+-binding RTX toxin-like protein